MAYLTNNGLWYIFINVLTQICATRLIGPTDFCEHEKFEANCKPGEVVVMGSATYGRMNVGRCINKQYGEIGCSMDVLPVMDDLCSGKSSCSVTVIHEALLSAKIEAKVCQGLSVYLSASYSCVQVISRDQSTCQSGPIKIKDKEGILSSGVASENKGGSSNCPWKLNLSGSIVNVTLYKFPKHSTNSLLASSSSLCYEIGRITENQNQKNMMVCGTDPRHKTVYVSHGGDVEISFTEKAVLDTLGRFLVSYKASACHVPAPIKNSHVKVIGGIITIQCNGSDTKWEFKCGESDKWLAMKHYCPIGKQWDIDDIFDHDEISVGIVLVVALGLTVFICSMGFILYIIYYYCRRCRENAAHERAVNTRDYTDEEKKGTENLIKFPPENENVKYRENTLRSNAGSSDTSSLDKRTISWPIRESFRHSSHADTLQFPDEHESESVSVEDETINSHVASEEVAIDCPDYGLPRK